MLRSLLEPVEKFSHRPANLPEEVESIREVLLRTETPEAEIFVDEWVYLMTHSWLVAKLKPFLTNVRAAGADVFEFTARSAREYRERLFQELVALVIPEARLPAVLTPRELRRVGIKWVIYGSSLAAGAAVAGPIGAVAGGLTHPVIRAIDP